MIIRMWYRERERGGTRKERRGRDTERETRGNTERDTEKGDLEREVDIVREIGGTQKRDGRAVHGRAT